MKPSWKKVVSAVLAGIMTLSLLTGCGGKNSSKSEEETSEYTYTASFDKLNLTGISSVSKICYSGGAFYILGTGEDGMTTGFYKMDSIESEPVAISGYVPSDGPEDIAETDDVYSSINSFAVSGDKIFCLESQNVTKYRLPKDFDPDTDDKWNYYDSDIQYTNINWFTMNGTEHGSISLNSLYPDDSYLYFGYFAADDSGNCYVANDSHILCINSEGKLAAQNDDFSHTFSWLSSLIKLRDGKVYAIGNTSEGTNGASVIDPATGKLGTPTAIPESAYYYYTGGGDYDMYYSDESNFSGYNLETGEAETLFNWVNCNVDSDGISSVIPMSDGSFGVLTWSYNDSTWSTEYEYATITKVLTASLPEKVTLTYATQSLNYSVRKAILNFNKMNDHIQIQVKDYSEYNTDDDYTAGLQKMTTEILAGNVPDLLDTNNLPMDHFESRGILENLWPYIDNDTELGGRDALVAPLFNALCANDGNLYQVCSNFYIQTMEGMGKATGSSTAAGWTVSDMKAAYEELPEGAALMNVGSTKSDVLNMVCTMCLGSMVDWSTGECDFDNENFVEMLEMCNMFPETYDWNTMFKDEQTFNEAFSEERFMQGGQLLNWEGVYSLTSLAYTDLMMNKDLEFVGFPSAYGNGSAFGLQGSIAMSSSCADKEAAWEFIRSFLTEEYQAENSSWQFPTNQHVLDDVIEKARTITYTEDENGQQKPVAITSFTDSSGNNIEIYNVSDELIEKFEKLLNTTTTIYTADTSLSDIIKDETTAFFSGQKTAEAVASLIQSRVNIYINEQK